jgi:hypothetical protein
MTRHLPFAREMLIAAFVSLSGAEAGAQVPLPAAASTFCFEVTGASDRAEGAILLNRCTGQTWILTRTVRPSRTGNGPAAYRWSAIPAAKTQVAANPLPPPEPVPPVPARPVTAPSAPASTSTAKCFTFQGRRYCE